jgi:hypothetical protein
VVDFQLSASPISASVFPNQLANSTITVTPVNGFTGTVSLSSTSSPSGLACTLSPSTIIGGSGSAFLSCSSSMGGTYIVTITGASGTLSHTTTVTVNVQDFTLTATAVSPTPIVQGNAGSSTITVGSLGGFSGTVNLAVSASPALGPVTISPSSITMSGSATLNIQTTTTTPTGTYLVNVTGMSGSLTHTVTIQVTVTIVTTVPPPFFTQMVWTHKLSLAKFNDVQTWTFSVKSNSTGGKIYFAVSITVTDGSGSTPFTLVTQVFSLAPHKNMQGLTLTATFSPSQIGETWNFIAVIHWGTTATTDPSQLPFMSTLTNGAPTSGSFTIQA